jgi:ribonuclease P protein component
VDATSLPSATSATSAPRNWANPISVAGPQFGFPKSSRILRRGDFRKVYDEGFRHSSPLFAAFCRRTADRAAGPRVGFTAPRALGKAVLRNRMKRRIREAVRLNLRLLPASWDVVFNPRRPLLTADFSAVEIEVRKVFERCANS